MREWKKGRKNDYMFEFSYVQYWQSQLRENGLKNIKIGYNDTKNVYIHYLLGFNEWLHGRKFNMSACN